MYWSKIHLDGKENRLDRVVDNGGWIEWWIMEAGKSSSLML